MKAVGSYIIVNKKTSPKKHTKGGLLLMEKDDENFRYKEAEVYSIGPDVKGIKTGQTIYYDKVAGNSIEIEDKEYIVIKNTDIVLVL